MENKLKAALADSKKVMERLLFEGEFYPSAIELYIFEKYENDSRYLDGNQWEKLLQFQVDNINTILNESEKSKEKENGTSETESK